VAKGFVDTAMHTPDPPDPQAAAEDKLRGLKPQYDINKYQ
jgi:hypothetical protein